MRTFADMDNIITISDCLKRLEAGEMVFLEVYQYDRKRKKGGKIESFDCVLLKNEGNQISEDGVMIIGRVGVENTVDEGNPDKIGEGVLRDKRNPNHRKFYTRNVRILINGHPSGVVYKIHPPLIRSFNGIKTVP